MPLIMPSISKDFGQKEMRQGMVTTPDQEEAKPPQSDRRGNVLTHTCLLAFSFSPSHYSPLAQDLILDG